MRKIKSEWRQPIWAVVTAEEVIELHLTHQVAWRIARQYHDGTVVLDNIAELQSLIAIDSKARKKEGM